VAKSKGKSRSTQVRSKLAIQVGERIRKTRKQEGLSIENFALRCDIHPSYVGHIERGMQNPTLSTLERISQGLGISMEDLFKDIDTPINVENAAIRHLSQIISELSPEQTQQLLQIVDSVMAIKKEYL
jgi:transcriptional regulator with XRE-family HTH domain